MKICEECGFMIEDEYSLLRSRQFGWSICKECYEKIDISIKIDIPTCDVCGEKLSYDRGYGDGLCRDHCEDYF